MRISDWSSDVCSSDLRIDIRPSRQRARYGLDRFQARTKTGDRFLVAFQLTIGKIGDLKICDTAEGGPCELRPHLALAGIGCDKEQPGGGVQLAAAQGPVAHPDDARINRSRMLDSEGRSDTIARPLQPQYINKTDGIGTGRSGNRLRQALKASLKIG